MKRRQVTVGVRLVLGWYASIGLAFAQPAGSGAEGIAKTSAATVGDFRFFAGVRLWANKWEISTSTRVLIVPDPANPASAVFQDVFQPQVSDPQLVPLPILGVRSGKFLASASYFPQTSYDSNDALIGRVKREEFDANLGYFVLPSLALSVGYKRATQDKLSAQVTPSGATVDGLLFGLSGSVPLAERLSAYGNFAYGFARQKTEIADAVGENRFKGNYRIGELGLLFGLYGGDAATVLNNLSVSLGYRVQTFTVESVAIGTFSPTAPTVPISTRKRDLQTTTDGVVMGVVAVF